MRFSKLGIHLGILISSFLLLASCAPAPANAPATAMPTAKTTAELTLWHAYGGALGKAFEGLVEEFNQTHPSIQVKPSYGGTLFTMREKLATAVASNSAPDIAQIDQFWSSELANANALLSLDDFITQDASFNQDDIWDKAWETARYNEKTWSLPFSLSNIALFYNKDLFQKAGLDPEKPPATWSELRKSARQLTTRDGQWGLTMPLKANEGNVYYWLAFLWQNDGALFSDDFKTTRFNEPAGVEALQFWVDLVKTDQSIPLTPPENGFETGKVAMTIASTAKLGAYLNALRAEKLGMAPLPQQKRAATGVGGANLAIMRSTKNQEAAWEFIRWMTNAEVNLKWSMASGYLPLRASVVKSQTYQNYLNQTPQAQIILDQMSTAVVRPNVPAYTPVSREIGLAIEEALFKNASPQNALDEATQKIAAR